MHTVIVNMKNLPAPQTTHIQSTPVYDRQDSMLYRPIVSHSHTVRHTLKNHCMQNAISYSQQKKGTRITIQCTDPIRIGTSHIKLHVFNSTL